MDLPVTREAPLGLEYHVDCEKRTQRNCEGTGSISVYFWVTTGQALGHSLARREGQRESSFVLGGWLVRICAVCGSLEIFLTSLAPTLGKVPPLQ